MEHSAACGTGLLLKACFAIAVKHNENSRLAWSLQHHTNAKVLYDIAGALTSAQSATDTWPCIFALLLHDYDCRSHSV